MNLFRNIYSWFKGLYGNNLYDYFAGKDCNGDSVLGNQFDGVIGWVVLAIAVVSAIIFYFVKFPNMGRKWKFWIAVLAVAIIGWVFGFGYSKHKEADMPYYVIYGVDNCYVAGASATIVTTDDASYDDEEEYEEDMDVEETVSFGGCETLVPYDGVSPQITNANFVAFGFVNAILAFCYFFILSIIIKRFSKHAAHNPWESKFGPQSVKRK